MVPPAPRSPLWLLLLLRLGPALATLPHNFTSDLQYIATQNFLIDIGLRRNSFADLVQDKLHSMRMEEFQHRSFGKCHWPCHDDFTITTNKPWQVASRKTNVLWQRAAVGPANVSSPGSLGTVTFFTEIEFSFDMTVNAYCHCKILFAHWSERICDHTVHFTGTVYVAAQVDVTKREDGTFQLDVDPKIYPVMSNSGCNPDDIVRWYEGSGGVEEAMNDQVRQEIYAELSAYGQTISADQAVAIGNDTGVVFYYRVTHMVFTTSDSIKVFAQAFINVTNDAGVVKTFPGTGNTTGGHRALPMAAAWNRYPGTKALLAGFRIAPDVFGNLFQGLAWAGVLSPQGNRSVYDAHLLFNLTMSQPRVVIDNVTAGHADINQTSTAGLRLREESVFMTMMCEEPHYDNKELYRLLYTVLGNVTETLHLQFDGDTGIYMELENASTTNASVDVFHSDALTPSKKQLRSIVRSLLNQSLPTINKLLVNYTIPFPKQAIPYVPNPQMKTVATLNGGYVEQSWMCDCHEDKDGWAKCQDKDVIDNMRDASTTLSSIFECATPGHDCAWIVSKLNTAILNYPPIDFECPAPNASHKWPTPSPSPSAAPSHCFDAAGSLACEIPHKVHFFCEQASVKRRCRKSCGLCGRRRLLADSSPASTSLLRGGESSCSENASNSSNTSSGDLAVSLSIFPNGDCSVAKTGATMSHVALPIARAKGTCLDAGPGSDRVLFGSRYYKLSSIPADAWCRRMGPLSLSLGCLPGPSKMNPNVTDFCARCLFDVETHPNVNVTLPAVTRNVSSGCPSLFPFLSPKAAGNFSKLGKVCYVNESYASAGTGPRWSWCAIAYTPEFYRIMDVGRVGRVCPQPAPAQVGLILSSDSRGRCAGGNEDVQNDTILVQTQQLPSVNGSQRGTDSLSKEITNLGNKRECLKMTSFFPPFSRAKLKTNKADGTPTNPPMVELWIGCLDADCSVGCYESMSPVTVVLGQQSTFLKSSGLVSTVILGSEYGLETCPPAPPPLAPPINWALVGAIIGIIVGLVALSTGAYVAYRHGRRLSLPVQALASAGRCLRGAGKACFARLQDSNYTCHKEPSTRKGDKKRFCVIFAFVYFFSVICGVLWYTSNPLELQLDLLEQNQQFSETYDDSKARALIRDARMSGLLIFVLLPLVLVLLVACCSWFSELRFFGWTWWDSRKTRLEAHKFSLSIRAIGFFEAGLLFALLSLTYWKDFWDAVVARPERDHANVFDMLGPSVNAILIIEMLTAWMKPWFIATHVVSWNAITVSWHRLCYSPNKLSTDSTAWDLLTNIEPQSLADFKRLATARNLVFPNITVVLLVHLFMSISLAAIIFRSGDVEIIFLILTAVSVATSVLVFILLAHQKSLVWLRQHENWTGSSKVFWASQVIVSAVLISMLCNEKAGGGAGFICLTAFMSSAASFVGTWHFMRRAEIELDSTCAFISPQEERLMADESVSNPPPVDAVNEEGEFKLGDVAGSGETGAADEMIDPVAGIGETAVVLQEDHVAEHDGQRQDHERDCADIDVDNGPLNNRSAFFRCAFEVPENSNRRLYGARIKWRRICLVVGAICMTVSALNDRALLWEDTVAIAWKELIAEMESYGGDDMLITPSNSSFLAPVVDGYGAVMKSRAQIKIVVALAFIVSAFCDLYKSTRKWLFLSRMFGFAGGLGATASLFVGFAPDYVNLLDFSSNLQKCGSEFCSEISKTTRLGFSSIMVAQAGATFVPILVSMPWTLGRIAFFLAEDKENSRAVVASLTWGSVSAIFRLTLLPLTIAYLYKPSTSNTEASQSTAFWYVERRSLRDSHAYRASEERRVCRGTILNERGCVRENQSVCTCTRASPLQFHNALCSHP